MVCILQITIKKNRESSLFYIIWKKLYLVKVFFTNTTQHFKNIWWVQIYPTFLYSQIKIFNVMMFQQLKIFYIKRIGKKYKVKKKLKMFDPISLRIIIELVSKVQSQVINNPRP